MGYCKRKKDVREVLQKVSIDIDEESFYPCKMGLCIICFGFALCENSRLDDVHSQQEHGDIRTIVPHPLIEANTMKTVLIIAIIYRIAMTYSVRGQVWEGGGEVESCTLDTGNEDLLAI